jgi:hypothetical protein
MKKTIRTFDKKGKISERHRVEKDIVLSNRLDLKNLTSSCTAKKLIPLKIISKLSISKFELMHLLKKCILNL